MPADFSFRSIVADTSDSLNSSNEMLSNVVTEVILQTDQAVWLGTGLGVSVIRDSLTVETLPSSTDLTQTLLPEPLLPDGGISAMAAGNDGTLFIAFAGSENDIPVGQGFALTSNASALTASDSTINWTYFNQQIEKIDNIIVSVGGGGLIAGVGSIIRQKFPQCKIIGVEPEGAKGLSDSIKNNKPLIKVNINSIADSLCAPLHMPYSFSICKNVINEMVTVSDQEMKKSMKFMFENFKVALEPACVAGISALTGPLKNKFQNLNLMQNLLK